MRHPAYDLKVNKEADRAVMIETIRRCSPLFGGENEYSYLGFGGPFLEDFKRVHSAFPEMKMVSLESDQNTFLRQEFHRFVNSDYLTLTKHSAHDFFRGPYQPSGKEIIWLDYLKFGRQELTDYVNLASKVAIGTMLRITVRGQWKDFYPGVANEDEWKRLIEGFRGNFGDLAPETLESEDFTNGFRYCSIISKMIVSAVRDELSSPLSRYFQPLTSTMYKDDTRMFSFMGVVASVPDPICQVQTGGFFCDKKILRAFQDWDLASLDGETVHLLDVPPLSMKERMALDRHLPIKPDSAHAALCISELPYLIGGSKNDHERLLARYASLSPYYAQFAQLVS